MTLWRISTKTIEDWLNAHLEQFKSLGVTTIYFRPTTDLSNDRPEVYFEATSSSIINDNAMQWIELQDELEGLGIGASSVGVENLDNNINGKRDGYAVWKRLN